MVEADRASSMPAPAMAHTLFSPTAYTSRKPLFRSASPMPPQFSATAMA